MKIKEEFKKLIPALSVEEYKQLEENCLAEGIRESIITWNGYIIDGHNRYEIATRHDLKYESIDKSFDSEDDVKEWMVNNQLGRRNLQDFVRGELMQTLEDLLKNKGVEIYKEKVGRPKKESLSIMDNDLKHNTQKIVSDKLGWSTGKKARFDVVTKKAPEEIKAQLRTGEISINQAYQDIKKEEKREQLAEKKERVNADNNEDIIINNKIKVLPGQVWRLGKHTLICGNFYEAKNVKADAIITDPPYGINYNPDWKKWDNTKSDFNKIKGDDNEFNPIAFLKYNTVLLFGANYFTKHLPIGSWLCWDKRTKEELDDMLGSPFELAWFKSINTKKTAIMVRILHGGVINADSKIGNNEKRYHPTQKPIVLFEEILQKLTKPNDVILDPFIGSGTTLLAAERTNRICIGYEIDPTYCEIIINRYKNLTNQEVWQELKE
jgi:DNA modification methylase